MCPRGRCCTLVYRQQLSCAERYERRSPGKDWLSSGTCAPSLLTALRSYVWGRFISNIFSMQRQESFPGGLLGANAQDRHPTTGLCRSHSSCWPHVMPLVSIAWVDSRVRCTPWCTQNPAALRPEAHAPKPTVSSCAYCRWALQLRYQLLPSPLAYVVFFCLMPIISKLEGHQFPADRALPVDQWLQSAEKLKPCRFSEQLAGSTSGRSHGNSGRCEPKILPNITTDGHMTA